LIIILLIAALIIILVFVFRIKAVIDVNNGDIKVDIIFFHIIKLQKKYVIKHEPDVLLKLYLITRKGLKPVISLPEIVNKIRKTSPTDIAFIDVITMFLQSFRKKQKKSVFNYLYRKASYDLAIDLQIGVEDAFWTAMACGLVNAASGVVCAVNNTKKHIIRVKTYPEFSKLVFSINVNCIITLSPADIIIGYVISKKNKNRR
jgi:hypothetical protein